MITVEPPNLSSLSPYIHLIHWNMFVNGWSTRFIVYRYIQILYIFTDPSQITSQTVHPSYSRTRVKKLTIDMTNFVFWFIPFLWQLRRHWTINHPCTMDQPVQKYAVCLRVEHRLPKFIRTKAHNKRFFGDVSIVRRLTKASFACWILNYAPWWPDLPPDDEIDRYQRWCYLWKHVFYQTVEVAFTC